nr:MAG TPA: hypothetical protein [Caudoviricetes sp.]
MILWYRGNIPILPPIFPKNPLFCRKLVFLVWSKPHILPILPYQL